MRTTGNESKKDRSKGQIKEEGIDPTAEVANSSSYFVRFMARQYTAAEGGVQTDMKCPECGTEIIGTYLPIFNCPHCDIQIWRDEKGNAINFEMIHTCPECNHSFNDTANDASSEFRKMCRTIEQQLEGVFNRLDHVVGHLFPALTKLNKRQENNG